jgi:subtilisin family serine protease
MKRILSVWFMLAFIVSVPAQYYYSYNNPIHLNKTDTIVIFSGNPDVEDYLTNNPSLIVSSNNKYTIISNKNMFPKGIVKSYPVYKTEDGCLLGCNGQILFFPNHEEDIDIILQSFPLEIIQNTPFYIIAQVSENSVDDDLSIANALQESGLVQFSHPNFIVNFQKHQDTISDPYFPYQFYLHSIGQVINDGHVTTADADINAPETWNITKGDSSIIIAVIDGGVTSDHPDLPNDRQLRLPNSNGAGPYDGTPVNDPSPWGNNNHGNACAGIIAASHNNEGISGVAPNCKIMPIRVPFSYVAIDVFATALVFATLNGADIISNSWGTSDPNPNAYPAIINAINIATTYGRNGKGCVVVFSAGNTANRVNNDFGYVAFPANCLNEAMITVGASDRNNQVAKYSPNGNKISVVAPSHKAYPIQISGENKEVWSMDIPGSSGYNPNESTGEVLPSSGTNHLSYTGRFGGTSAACPQIAGVSALMLSVNPTLSSNEIKNIIERTTKKIGSMSYDYNLPNGTWNQEMGFGLVDAHKAVIYAMEYGHDSIIGSSTIADCEAKDYQCEFLHPDIFTYNWTASSNLGIVEDRGNSITVTPLSVGVGTISVDVYQQGRLMYTMTKTITVTSAWNSYPPVAAAPLHITSNTIWSSEMYLPAPITVDSAAILTITGIYHCGQAARFIVRPGGKLVVDGGTLTSACSSEMWQGIEVVGDRTKRQISQWQGTVELKNGAVIENAHCGIRTGLGEDNWHTTGGIIKADSAFFINNRRAVAFLSYTNHSPAGTITDNQSSFSRCVFTVDNNNLFSQNNASFIDHVTMWEVRGVKFLGCTFSNQTSERHQRRHAIYADDAGFKIDTYCKSPTNIFPDCECPEALSTYNTFSGFSTAVEVLTTGVQHAVQINHALFSNNYTAVKIDGNHFASVTRCEFDLGQVPIQSLSNKGLDLRTCTGYLVEENTFSRSAYIDPTLFASTGIYVDNSGNSDNLLHRNTFEKLGYGIRVNGANGDSRAGLQATCNDFIHNKYDIYMSNGSSMKKKQGESGKGADNSFSNTQTSSFRNPGPQDITYYYSNGGNHVPYNVTPSYVALNNSATANPCTSTLCNDGWIQPRLAEFQSDMDACTGSTQPLSNIYHTAVRAIMSDTVLDLNELEMWHTAAQPIADPYSLTETRFMEGYAEIFAENAETDAETANYAEFHALKLSLRGVNDGIVGANNHSPLQTDGHINWYALTPAQIAQLQTIAERNTGRASVMAKGVLCFFHGICYEDDLFGDDNMDNHDNNMETRSAKVSQQDGETNLTVYPNPTDDVLFIELRGGTGIANMALYDLQGRAVETRHGTSLQGGTATINVRNVPAGVYVLQVTDADGNEYHQKIVRK